jgi:transposase-like protein
MLSAYGGDPEAAYQRCVGHFYRNVWSLVPATKVRPVAAMLKAVHVSEDRAAVRLKAGQVVAKLREMKLPAAAALVEGSIEETFSYKAFNTGRTRAKRWVAIAPK